MPHWFWLIFLAAYGACVGSFLNVVIYRLPEGKGIVKPRSRCPKCEHALAWYDNVPVLGWLWLRGRCRYCKNPISIQYPVVEALVALMFAGLYVLYYLVPLRPEFYKPGFSGTWPIYIVHLVLLSGLFASTVIDAKLYIIPRSIPWVVSIVAVVVMPPAVQYGWVLLSRDYGLFPIARPTGVTVAAGGLVGTTISLVLLKLRVFPISFADYEQAYAEHQKQHADAEQEPWFHYPHARREVCKEILFLLPPIAGMAAGWFLAPADNVALWQPWVFVLGGIGLGYLFGAILVWATRILGTFLFGKEAMGLGDVHLLAAIGAVMGPGETIPVFFIAPFFGLAAALGTYGLGTMLKKRFQPIPYGPYLAGAAVIVLIWREPIIEFLRPLFELEIAGIRIFDILFVL